MTDTPRGIRLEVSNSDNDDFINKRWSIRMIHPEGAVVRWTVPDALLETLDWEFVNEKLLEELATKRRIRRNTPWLFGGN